MEKFKNTFSIFMLFFAIICFTSCDNNDQLTSEECKLSTVTIYDFDYDATNNPINSENVIPLNVTYSGNDIINLYGNPSVHEFIGGIYSVYPNTFSINYSYLQGKVIRKDYQDQHSFLNENERYVTYNYNVDGSLNEIDHYNPFSILESKMIFIYNSTSKLIETRFYGEMIGSPLDFDKSIYSYTGNNITKIEVYNGITGVLYTTHEFTVDTSKNNAILNLFPSMIPFDPYIDDDDTNFMIPLFQNPNLVTSRIETETGNTPITEYYTYQHTTSPNGNSLLSDVKINNENYLSFNYNCN